MVDTVLQFHADNAMGVALAAIPMVANIAVFWYALRRLPRDQLTTTFLLYIVCACTWQAFDIMVRVSETAETARFWRAYLRMGQIYGIAIGLHFAMLYAQRDRIGNAWWFWTLLYVPPSLQLGGYMAGHWEEQLVYHEGWGWLSDASAMGTAYQIHLVIGSATALFTLAVLVWNTRRVWSQVERRQASLALTIGLSITVVLGVVFEGGLPMLGYHQWPITSTVTVFFTVGTFIGLSRYSLFRVSTPAAAQAVIEALTDPLLIARADGRLLYANEAASDSFGLDRDRIQTYHLGRLFPVEGDALAFFAGRWVETLRGARANGLEARFQSADGTVAPFLVSLAPIPISRQGDPGVAVVAHDVSRLKAIERDLVDARDQAEFANRTKSEFLANMSHELRTPLNAIIGYAELVAEDAEDDATREDLARIERSGRYLLDLINDVLDLSKVESGKLELRCEPVDIARSMEGLIPTFDQLRRRNGNALVVDVDDDLAPVHADPMRLRQVLLNLVSNACKFTEDGEVRIEVRQADGRTFIDVTDSGLGMDEQQVARLFGMFTQVHQIDRERYGGTGLGLALSRRLCNLMDGDVTVLRSELGVGSTFRVDLPTLARSSG
jgi:PAS domain S-box-containing protein